jgi:hypothetical protein
MLAGQVLKCLRRDGPILPFVRVNQTSLQTLVSSFGPNSSKRSSSDLKLNPIRD